MTLQLTITVLAIALAAVYVAWSNLRVWRGTKSGCGNGCGKCAEPIAESKPGRVSLL